MSFVLPMTLFSYLSRRYLQIVLIATLGLVTFISFIEIIEILRRAGNKAPDLSALYLILVSLLNIPSIFDQALPFGVLFGSISCFHLWSRSHEFLVARVMGQNIWQALMPVMITVFLLGCVHVAIINPVASASAKQYNFVMKSIFGQADASELSVLTNGVWVRDSDASYNVIINGGSLDVKNSLIIDPIIYHLDQEGQLLWRTQAASMKLTKNGWIIVDAVKISNAGESSILGDVIMPTVLRPSDLSESTLPPKTVSIYRLPNFIEVQQRAGLPVNPHLVFFHQLLSTPLKLLGLALLAASFTLTSFSRQTKVRLILVGVASGFGIYFLSNFVYLLGSSAKLPHLLAGWGQPLWYVCSADFCLLELMNNLAIFRISLLMRLLPPSRILIPLLGYVSRLLSVLCKTELRMAAICAMSFIVLSADAVEANQRVSVVALVNGEPITSLDLENRMKFLRLLSNLEMDEADFRADTLQKLVVEKIKLQAAKEQLSQYIGEASSTARQLIDRNFTRDGKAGSQILSEIGISTATVTEQYVADILWGNALRIRFPRQFENLENLAELELERLKKAQNEPQIKLREILLQPNPKRPLDKTTQLADKIVGALKKNSDFTSIASQYSEAATAAQGGRVNWMLVSQLPAPLRQPLIEADTNAIIGPLEFEGRIYILKKDGFREYGLSDPTAASLTLVRAILPLLADASREERTAATKQIAAQTADLQTCEEMASLNENLASGSLPYLKDLQIGSLSPQLQKIVAPLQIGEKTSPLPFAEGMTVFMVCARNQPKIELPDIETLKQAEFEKLLTNISGRYLLRLQRKAVIDYRS